MAEESSTIPGYLREAFHEAVQRFKDEWSPTLPDRKEIDVDGTRRSIGEVCGLVDTFGDVLPDNIYRDLFDQMHTRPDLKQQLGSVQSYANAASCMREMMRQRISAYQELEKRRDR
jgi:hypothetical protein